MKKFILAMFVVMTTVAGFTSCSKSEDNIGLSDLLGNTFACTEDNDGNDFEYSIKFNDDTEFSFKTSDGETGTYAVVSNVVTLTFDGGDIMTLKGDGSKKLICDDLNCTLKKK